MVSKVVSIVLPPAHGAFAAAAIRIQRAEHGNGGARTKM
jgi:hypothetical protein